MISHILFIIVVDCIVCVFVALIAAQFPRPTPPRNKTEDTISEAKAVVKKVSERSSVLMKAINNYETSVNTLFRTPSYETMLIRVKAKNDALYLARETIKLFGDSACHLEKAFDELEGQEAADIMETIRGRLPPIPEEPQEEPLPKELPEPLPKELPEDPQEELPEELPEPLPEELPEKPQEEPLGKTMEETIEEALRKGPVTLTTMTVQELLEGLGCLEH